MALYTQHHVALNLSYRATNFKHPGLGRIVIPIISQDVHQPYTIFGEKMSKYTVYSKLIAEHFNLGELRGLCFDLDIQYEDLPGDTRNDKARELVANCERHGRLDDLIARCEQLRPSVNWPPPYERDVDKKPLQGHNNLPPPLYSRFIRREKAFSKVIQCLEGRNSTVLISGLGGTGKTSLAREIAGLSLKDTAGVPEYEAAVWVSVPAKPGTTTLNAVLDEIARTLDYPGLTQLDIASKQFRVSQLLRKHHVLIVVDGFMTVPDHSLTEWLLQQLPEPSKAIITSRTQDQSLWDACSFELEGMEEEEAQEFVKELMHVLDMEDLTSSQLSRLIETTGGNPFAIELILRSVKKRNLRLDQTLNSLYRSRIKFKLFDKLFANTWSYLDETDNSAQELLMLMTLFPESASNSALLEVSGMRESIFDRAIASLLDLSLLKKSDFQGELRYSLHPLVRTFASGKLQEDPEFAGEAGEKWLAWIIKFVKEVEWPWRDLSKLEQLKPEEETAFVAIKWTAEHQRHEMTITLARGLDHYYYVRGHWDKKAVIDQLRIEAARKLGDLAEEALALAQYAQMLCTRGRPEDLDRVKEEYLPRLDGIESSCSLPLDTIAAIRHANAFYHMAHRDYDSAIEILSNFQEQVQAARANYAIANRHWLAFCLYKNGKRVAAEEQFRKSLDEADKENYQRSIAFSNKNLAEIALDNKDIVTAQTRLAEAMELAKEIGDRRYLAQTQLVYARLYLEQGKLVPARQAYAAAEDGFRRLNLHTDMEQREMLREKLDELSLYKDNIGKKRYLEESMEVIRSDFDFEEFLNRLGQSKHRTLLSDYDGTLAPFRDAKERNLAFPYEGVREVLTEIIAGGKTRVVIISARAVQDLIPLLGIEPLPEIWGIYGWERRHSDGTYLPPEPNNPKAVSALRNAIAWGKENNLEYEYKPDETTPVSVAFHWRVSDDARGRSPGVLRDLIVEYTNEIARSTGLRVKLGDQVRELMIPGKSKDTAVKTVLSEIDSTSIVAYLGDSKGDEDAFEALNGVGLSVLVSSRSRESAADLRIQPPDGLLEFLRYWL